jgi:hypothetical protein
VAVKPKPGSQRSKKEKAKDQSFLGQQQHGYVSGSDCATVPDGLAWSPPCGCRNHGTLDYNPGPHATWDCPLRYIQRCGRCPGFRADGSRDPAQWLGGNILTREAKDDWLKLLKDYNLPLPREPAARPPPFSK